MVTDHVVQPAGTPAEIGKAQSLLASMWTAMGELRPIANLEALGWKLYRLAFSDSNSELLFARTLGEMEKAGGNLRLWIDCPSLDLACLPWEYLTVPAESRELYERAEVTLRSPFLALHSHLTIQRRVPGFDADTHLRAPEKLRVLVAWANPKGEWGDVTSVEREAENVRELLHTLGSDFVDFDHMEAVSKTVLLDKIRTFRPHVLHYNGHGCFPEVESHLLTTPPDEPGLILGFNGKVEYLTAAELVKAASANLRLVILNCCWGAAGTQFGPSFAARLFVGTPIGAVIANQTPIKTALAVSLTSRLYRELAAGKPLDEAIQSYRHHAAAEPKKAHWGVPVLYSRVGEMRLFEKIRLTKGAIDLGPILDRHPPDLIVGRTWLKDRVSNYVEGLRTRRAGGTFLLTAAPGMGKTAFAAKLARNLDGVIPFFYSYRDGIRDPNRFLQQTIREIQVRFGWIEEQLDFTRDILHSLMERAGERSLAEGRMQTFLVDALDEAETQGLSAAGALPVRVPPGVCVIALTRPGPWADEIRNRYDVEHYNLTSGNADNLEDARAACEKLLFEVCPGALQEPDRAKKLAEQIAEKSCANFLVIRMFFLSTASETVTLEVLEQEAADLSASVKDIYGTFFNRMEQGLIPQELEYTSEVLGAFAAAQAAVTSDMVSSAFSLKRAHWKIAIRHVRQFLAESLDDSAGDLSYTTFHETFREFLVTEYLAELSQRHCGWARYCAGWKTHAGAALRYALQFLPVHLDQCGDREALLRLLRDLNFAKRRTDLIGPYGYTRFFSGVINRGDIADAERTELRIIQRVLDQNTHVLAREPDQFLERIQNGLQQRLGSPARVEELTKTIPSVGPWLRLNNRPVLGIDEALIRTLEGHGREVTSVAVDGPRGVVVSGSWDGTVKIWDLETGELRRTLGGHTGGVNSVAVESARGVVVSGSWDGTVQIWDLETGQLRRTVEGHTEGGTSVAVDGTRGLVVLSGSWGQTVKIWDLETGQLRRTVEGHTEGGTSVVVDGTRGLVVSAARDKAVIWDLETGQLRRTLEGHMGYVASVAVDRARGVVVSGSSDKTVKIWDLETGQLRQTLAGYTEEVTSVAVDGTGGLVVSDTRDKAVIWDLETGQVRRTLEGHTGKITSVVVDAARGVVVSGSSDKTVKIWDLGTDQLRRTLKRHMGWVTSLAVDVVHGMVASGSSDRTVKIWDLETGQLRRTLEGHTDDVASVAVDGRRGVVVSGSDDRTVKIWDLETGRLWRTLQGHTWWVTSVAVDSGRGVVVSGSWDHTVKIWDLETGQLRRTLEGHTGYVASVAVDPARGVLVSGSNDQKVKIWDLETGQLMRTLEGHEGEITSVAVDRRRGVLVSGSRDYRVKIWDLDTGRLRRTLGGHTQEVTSVALDGARGVVVSGSQDRTVRIWDLERGTLVRRREFNRGVLAVATDADRSGRILAGVEGEPGVPCVWDFTLEPPRY